MESQNADAVFKSVGQALYVAFVMEVTPPTTKGATQILIEDLLRQRYAEEERPKSERSINMGDMSPLELRGQCALIRAAVKDHLSETERYSIYARFGYRVTKADGVQGLRDQYASLCNTRNVDAIHALLWAIYVPGVRKHDGESVRAFNKRRERRESEWSLRGIEKEYAVAKSVLHRDQQMLRNMCHRLEEFAQGKLEELFIRTALVEDPNYA